MVLCYSIPPDERPPLVDSLASHAPVTVVYSCVTVLLQWCHSGVTVVLQRCYSGVHRGFTVVLRMDSRASQAPVTIVVQCSYSGVTIEFQ
jgi:hypothetical protein